MFTKSLRIFPRFLDAPGSSTSRLDKRSLQRSTRLWLQLSLPGPSRPLRKTQSKTNFIWKRKHQHTINKKIFICYFPGNIHILGIISIRHKNACPYLEEVYLQFNQYFHYLFFRASTCLLCLVNAIRRLWGLQTRQVINVLYQLWAIFPNLVLWIQSR